MITLPITMWGDVEFLEIAHIHESMNHNPEEFHTGKTLQSSPLTEF